MGSGNLCQILPNLPNFAKFFVAKFYQIFCCQILPNFTKFCCVLPNFVKWFFSLPNVVIWLPNLHLTCPLDFYNVKRGFLNDKYIFYLTNVIFIMRIVIYCLHKL